MRCTKESRNSSNDRRREKKMAGISETDLSGKQISRLNSRKHLMYYIRKIKMTIILLVIWNRANLSSFSLSIALLSSTWRSISFIAKNYNKKLCFNNIKRKLNILLERHRVNTNFRTFFKITTIIKKNKTNNHSFLQTLDIIQYFLYNNIALLNCND